MHRPLGVINSDFQFYHSFCIYWLFFYTEELIIINFLVTLKYSSYKKSSINASFHFLINFQNTELHQQPPKVTNEACLFVIEYYYKHLGFNLFQMHQSIVVIILFDAQMSHL